MFQLLTPAMQRVCTSPLAFDSVAAWRGKADAKQLDLDYPFTVAGVQDPVRERYKQGPLRADLEYFETAINQKAGDGNFFRGRGFVRCERPWDLVYEMIRGAERHVKLFLNSLGCRLINCLQI